MRFRDRKPSKQRREREREGEESLIVELEARGARLHSVTGLLPAPEHPDYSPPSRLKISSS